MRVAELLNSIEDDVDMVKAEPLSDSEGPWESSPTPAVSPASTPSSAFFTPAMSPAGSLRAAGSDVGESDMIDIKMEVLEEEPGIAANAPSPAPPHLPPPHHHQPLSPFDCRMFTWQTPPPTLGWATWMAPPPGLYSLHRLNDSPQGPMFVSDADMAYALALTPPKDFYASHECTGFAGGPSLMAFHCHMLQFRSPKLELHGKSIRDLGFEYLDAMRMWNEEPTDDSVGIMSERLAWRTMAAIMSFRERDHVNNFVDEVRRAISVPRPELPARQLEQGLHGALSMTRLMHQCCQEPDAVRSAEELAVEIIGRLNLDYIGYPQGGTLCGGDGGMRDIFTSYSSIEEDLGILTEITAFWPEGARQCRGIRIVTADEDKALVGVTYETQVATIFSETIRILEERIDCVFWPERVARHCARHTLKRGPWYVYSCLWHLDQWLCGSWASPGLKERVSLALRLVSEYSHARRSPPVPAPASTPVIKCGICGCRPNPTIVYGSFR